MSKMKANAILNLTGAVFKPLEPKIPPHLELQEVLRSRLDTRRPPYHDHLSDGLCIVVSDTQSDSIQFLNFAKK